MCGRITQKSNPQKLGLGLTTVTLVEPLQTLPRYNSAPGQDHWIIRQHPKTGEHTLDRLWWGLIPRWVKNANGGRKPIKAKSESVASLASFQRSLVRCGCPDFGGFDLGDYPFKKMPVLFADELDGLTLVDVVFKAIPEELKLCLTFIKNLAPSFDPDSDIRIGALVEHATRKVLLTHFVGNVTIHLI